VSSAEGDGYVLEQDHRFVVARPCAPQNSPELGIFHRASGIYPCVRASGVASRVLIMAIDPPPSEPVSPPGEPPFDPVRERERILALVRGRTFDAYQAEFVCATLALLAEMEPEVRPLRSFPPR